MFIPTAMIQATELIREGSIEIQIGENSVRLERDHIRVNLSDMESLRTLMDREDILPQVKYLSEEFSRTGKTLEIRYRNKRIVYLGADADSFVFKMLGIDHVTVGNPFTVYQFLRVWGKD
jgi:hypothetical protein